MKFKALRTKREPKEFVHVTDSGIFTSEFPDIMTMQVTIDLLKTYFSKQSEVDFDDYELIEFEMFEVNTVGADIRNKLTPSLNLISLLNLYFNEIDNEKRKLLLGFIQKEMKQSKLSIEYLSKLF